MKILTEEQRERNRLSAEKWRNNNREKHREYSRRYAKEHPEAIRNYFRKLNWRKYGVALYEFEIYKEMLGKVLCPICLNNKATGMDHNHKTKKHRSLLCNGCNLRLGWFERNKDRILGYIKTWELVEQ